MTTTPSPFANAQHNGVYRLPHGDLNALLEQCRAADCLALRIDCHEAQTVDDMLDAIAKALRFPEWFGHNWDALYDCLLDMAWLPATGYVLIIEHADTLHERFERDFAKLMDSLAEVADIWRADDIPFWCLVDAHAGGMNELVQAT